MYQTRTKISKTETCIRSQAHFLVESRMDDFSVIWGVRLDAQTLVLLLFELNSPCLSHCQLLLGWQRLIPSENCQRWMWKMGYQFQVDKHSISTAGSSQLNSMSSRSDSSYPLVSYLVLQHWRVPLLSFQMFPVGWELWELEASDCPKILVFGTATKTKLPAEFPQS